MSWNNKNDSHQNLHQTAACNYWWEEHLNSSITAKQVCSKLAPHTHLPPNSGPQTPAFPLRLLWVRSAYMFQCFLERKTKWRGGSWGSEIQGPKTHKAVSPWQENTAQPDKQKNCFPLHELLSTLKSPAQKRDRKLARNSAVSVNAVVASRQADAVCGAQCACQIQEQDTQSHYIISVTQHTFGVGSAERALRMDRGKYAQISDGKNLAVTVNLTTICRASLEKV